jgi:thiol-disulfide isomerase/thioredoxin
MRAARILAAGALILATAVAMALVVNAPPSFRQSPPAQASSPRPYVIKLHARWCPVCMMTRGAWADVQKAYDGRVNLAVFDFTSGSTTDASRAEARRLGLEPVFDDHLGETGTVLVVDGASKKVTAVIHGSRDAADYRTAIDAALAAAPRSAPRLYPSP